MTNVSSCEYDRRVAETDFASCVIRYVRHAHWAAFFIFFANIFKVPLADAHLLYCVQSTTVHIEMYVNG